MKSPKTKYKYIYISGNFNINYEYIYIYGKLNKLKPIHLVFWYGDIKGFKFMENKTEKFLWIN
jgi:hypothetical protein